jgi:hypothetical protein
MLSEKQYFIANYQHEVTELPFPNILIFRIGKFELLTNR